MRSLLSFALAIFCVLSTITGIFVFTGSPTEPEDDFVPVVRFMAASDVHIQTLGDTKCVRLIKAIRSAYDIAASDKDYDKLDGICLTGDVTDDGMKTQYLSLASVLKNEVKDGTEIMTVQAKSHDCKTLGREALDFYSSLSGKGNDYHNVINDIHFIGLSASHDESVHYDSDQLKWLDEQLAEASSEDPEKPIFVFQHEHIKDTVFGSYDEDGWGVDYFTDILNKYPQVIDISGHSHYPANDPKAVWQGNFTAINDGGLNYYEFTFDGRNSYHPDDSGKMAQILIIEIDESNNVLVRVYDVTAEQFIYEYLIDNVAQANKTKFSHDVRRRNATAPIFDKDAAIKASKRIKGSVFSIPQAKAGEDDIVYEYRLKVFDTEGNIVAKQAQLSKYYLAKVPDTVKFDAIKLEKGNYTVSVTPVDAWGLEGEAISLNYQV